jgi:hypothetical protein
MAVQPIKSFEVAATVVLAADRYKRLGGIRLSVIRECDLPAA